MTFSEKITSIMTLSQTSNIELANALDIDRSTVSRFKTGARNMPKLPTVVKMSEFFAAHIGTGFRAMALFDLTGDPRLQQRLTFDLVSDVIYRWFIFTNENENSQSNTASFINNWVTYSDAPTAVAPVNGANVDSTNRAQPVSGETSSDSDFASDSISGSSSNSGSNADTNSGSISSSGVTIGSVSNTNYASGSANTSTSAPTLGSAQNATINLKGNEHTPSPSHLYHMPTMSDEFSVYVGNEGKRQALKDFFDYALSLEKPTTIRLFSDESMGWQLEDPRYSKYISQTLLDMADKGYSFQRIEPPNIHLEYTLLSSQRWIPVCLRGNVHQYHYPFARDELHRRTMLVVPGKLVLTSSSFAGEQSNYITLISTQPNLIDSIDKDFDIMLSRCRQSLVVHTIDRPKEMFDSLASISAIGSDTIYKSSTLSAATLPERVLLRMNEEGSTLSTRIFETMQERNANFEINLVNHTITDMIYLHPYEDILSGKVQILSSSMLKNGVLYYTAEEYVSHLRRIMWYIEHYQNYHVVLVDDPIWKNVIIYAKSADRTLLIRDEKPVSVFEIREQNLSDSIWSYLTYAAKYETTVPTKQETVVLLQKYINHLTQSSTAEKSKHSF